METEITSKYILNECGFSSSSKKSHATEYRNNDVIVYTVPSEQLNLVINPEDYVYIKAYNCKKYHNSNLKAYPKVANEGETKIHYGYKIVFDNSISMKQFLIEYVQYKAR